MSQFLSTLKAYLTSPTFNTVRAILYAAVPASLGALVTAGKLSQNTSDLWVAIVVAFFGPALASVFAPNGWRTWVFGLLAPIQALLVGVGGAHNVVGMLIAAIIGAVLTGGVAASNVRNTSAPATPST
jgi:hypothetical protein